MMPGAEIVAAFQHALSEGSESDLAMVVEDGAASGFDLCLRPECGHRRLTLRNRTLVECVLRSPVYGRQKAKTDV